jgi:hypothetical protein
MPPRLLPDCITLTSRVVNYIHIPLLMCPMPALPVTQPVLISQTFQNNTQHPVSQSPQTTIWRNQFSLILRASKPSPSNFSMPRNHDTVKVADLRRAKSRAKLIEWEPRVHSRGIRDVPVEVRATASQPRPRKKGSEGERAQNNDTVEALQGETAPQSMDIDNSFWAEDPVAPTNEKRVRQPACPS